MKKYLNPLLIAAPVVLLGILTIYLAVLRSSLPEVTVRIYGYDPRDLLAGHYIEYRIDWDDTDCEQFEDKICPTNEFYTERWGGRWSDHRFYVPEQYAKELDRILRTGNINYGVLEKDAVFEVVYSYRKGFKPMAKQLLINGKDWRETIKNRSAQETNATDRDEEVNITDPDEEVNITDPDEEVNITDHDPAQ